MRPAQLQKLPPRVFGVVVVAVGALAFSNSFAGVYVFDDTPNIVENLSLHSWQASWEAEGAAIPIGLQRREMGRWSFALNYAISGLDTWSYHAVNLAIHLAAALLLFGIVRRTVELRAHEDELRRDANWLAWGIAGLWVVHPLQTESVTYIVQRLESLCGLFYLACFYAIVRGSQSTRPWAWYLGAVAACFAGMRTKEVMVTAPVVLLCFDRIFLAGSWRQVWCDRRWVYVGMAIAMSGLLWSAAGNILPKFKPTETITSRPPLAPHIDKSELVQGDIPVRFKFFLAQPGVVLHYLQLAFWPQGQCLDQMWPVPRHAAEVLLPMAVILVIIAIGVVALWKLPPVGFLILSFFVILSPTSSIIPLRVAFEHRMYLSLACLIALVVLGCYQRLGLRPYLPVAMALAMIALGAATHERNKVYHSRVAMYRDNVAKAPHNPRAFLNLSGAYLEAGRLLEAQRAAEAAVELRPKDSATWSSLGAVLVERKVLAEACKCLQHALKLNSGDSTAHHRLAEAFERQGDWAAALPRYREAVRLAALDPQIHNDFAAALAARGYLAEAEEHLRLALRVDPESAEAHNNLGTVLMMRQMSLRQAIEHFRRAVSIDPESKDARLNLRRALQIEAEQQRERIHTLARPTEQHP